MINIILLMIKLFSIYTSLSAIYILWILTTRISSLKFLTAWIIIVQGIYFLSEFHWNKRVPQFMQNLAWTLSIFLLSYWPIKYYFKWPTIESELFHDLTIHGFNILLVVIACLWKPKLEHKYIWVPIVFGIIYLTFAIIYTKANGSIYPTNFFVIDYRMWYDLLAVFVGTPLIHTLGVYLMKCIKKCREKELLPISIKKIWRQQSLFEYHKA